VAARQGPDAARTRHAAGGVAPAMAGLLAQVQMDHTPIDVIVVSEDVARRRAVVRGTVVERALREGRVLARP